MRAAEIFYFLLRMPFLSPDLRVKIEAYSPVIGDFQIDKRVMVESHKNPYSPDLRVKIEAYSPVIGDFQIDKSKGGWIKKHLPYSPDLRVKIEAYSPVIGDFQIDKSKVLTSVILGAI